MAKFRGTGLAEVRDQKCMGCQVMLRPQTYNEVRNGEKVMVCESCSRVYYFNPANEVKPEQEVVTVTGRKRARPKADAPQAWFYRPDYGEEGEVLLAFTNSGGNSTRRIYEMHTGRQFGDVLMREGSYRQAFPEDLTETALRLNGHWDEKEIDEWGSEIPSNVLDLLQKDMLAIRREHRVEPQRPFRLSGGTNGSALETIPRNRSKTYPERCKPRAPCRPDPPSSPSHRRSS